jgi:hypothetical protein
LAGGGGGSIPEIENFANNFDNRITLNRSCIEERIRNFYAGMVKDY